MAARWKWLRGRRRARLDARLWSRALVHCRYAQALSESDQRRLREAASLFIDTKSFEGAAGFRVTPEVRAVIALKACVPILNLSIDYYDGWRDIIVYPGDFRVRDQYMDDAGVLHEETRELCGESLTRGPMVLSWQTMEEEQATSDRDLVIHECAHKLDIQNGDANGFPPLHSDMAPKQWADVFSVAYNRLNSLLDDEKNTTLDPYAATDAPEFFAVATETFFTCPSILVHDFPDVYRELARFYRQDTFTLLGDSP